MRAKHRVESVVAFLSVGFSITVEAFIKCNRTICSFALQFWCNVYVVAILLCHLTILFWYLPAAQRRRSKAWPPAVYIGEKL